MSELAVIEGEIVGGNHLPAVPGTQTLIGAREPQDFINRMTDIATALKDVVQKRGLISNIQGKEHPQVEAWTCLGSMLGVFPVCTWSRPVENGWEARVEARTLAGAVVGAAEAQCLRSESNWRNRDDFALRSMAQTRATSKALRLPLGFVMTLAGYSATPAEEMLEEKATRRAAPAPRATAANPALASEKQVGMIRALMSKMPKEMQDQFATAMQADYSVASATELTKKEASEVIERLQTLEKALEGGE